MDRPKLKASITEVVKEEEYTLKDLTTVSMFLQNLGRKQWPDMFSDIFALGEFIHEIKDSLYTDDAPIPFEDKEWGTDRPATVRADKPVRSRKEKPPRSATKVMKVGTGGNPIGVGFIILMSILTVIACLIGLFNSLR